MQTINDYVINEEIYRGSNTIIYRASKKNTANNVIIKILKSEYPTPEEIKHFIHEYNIAQYLGEIDSIINDFDIIEYQNTKAIIMEDFGASSLDYYIKNTKVSLEKGLDIAIKASEAIAQIHKKNVIHKDIKPQNILFNDETSMLKIIDFGLSTQLNREIQKIINPDHLEGTLAYISPEQTGRMNRSIDYRTDFYSLGVTLYELFSGKKPFESNDPMELVHSHIAKTPSAPHNINENVPEVLSQIIMKLLKKTAEERYQNAFSIKRDLELCLTEIKKGNRAPNFKIAENDISDTFQIPEKLYGRESEIEKLLSAFKRTADGNKEISFISGLSGIGKSALINEIHKPIIEKRGYFISGKHEQFKKALPYTAITEAFRDLIKEILTENKTKLNIWKEKILKAVGINGQIIIDIIPELELIIGTQPEVEKLPAAESLNRFNLIFQNFIKIFAEKEHPLVVFIDDLQWADSATLNMIEVLLDDEELTHFLFFGAYRNNEVPEGHPLKFIIKNLKSEGRQLEELELESLKVDDIVNLLSETLHSTKAKTTSLANLVSKKTDGNPFFIKEFLKALYETRLITFENEWQWDLSNIEQAEITENVVELMAQKIQKLPNQSLEIIKIASCYGSTFNLKTLSNITKLNEEDIIKNIKVPINEGMLLSTEESIKFVHDKVKEAAYSLIEEKEKNEIHYKIGTTLLKESIDIVKDENIFSIANQLNLVKALLTAEEREQLLKINLESGKKAKQSAAYSSSVDFFKHGAELITENNWKTDYAQTLTYYTEWAEAEYLARNFEESEKLFDYILSKAESLMDKVKVYDLKMDYYTSQSKFQEAIEVGRVALDSLDISFPDSIDENVVGDYFQQTSESLSKVSVEQLYDLPQVSDEKYGIALRILIKLCIPAYLTNPNFFVVVILKSVILSIEHGSEPAATPFAYATYAIILAGILNDIKGAYDFGALAVKLSDETGLKVMQSQCYYSFTWQNHWKEPLRDNINYYKKAFEYCQDTGNFQFLDYTCNQLCFTYILVGENLNKVNEIYDEYTSIVKRLKQKSGLYFYCYKQTVKNLIGQSSSRIRIKSEDFDEDIVVKEYHDSSDFTGLGNYYIPKMILSFIFEDYKQAGEMANNEQIITGGLLAQPLIQQYYFYYAITLAALYTTASKDEQASLLEKLNTISETFKPWAEQGTQNYMHKYKLIQAEIARITGKPMEEVSALYDEAIAGAKKNRFTHEEAIANECAARYYLSKGRDKIAKSYMIEARYCYIKWGCKPKVELLEEKFPELFSSLALSSDSTVDISLGSISAASIATRSSSGALTTVMLDMNTIMKASQTIAGEIEMENLLSRFMKIVIENAGAQKGLLVFKGEKDELLIEAESEVDQKEPSILQSIPLEESSSLSPAIIRYVDKTKEPLVLDNASEEGTFTRDDYIKSNKIVSVLCLPVIKQDKIIAILYLENNLTPGSFTPSRVETLRVLSSQAAISIENARMVEQMREKERLKREMELAERLQTSLVPPAPDHDELDIAVCMKPAEEVGGDYYDTIFDIEKKLWLAIGDVSGHGMTPGLVMMMAETAFHTHIIDSKGKTPRDAVIAVNKVLTENIRTRLKEKHFMTMSFVKYDGDGNFSYSGAHLDIMVYRKATGKVELFKTEGLYLGIMPDLTKIAQDKSFKLEVDDVMLLYTDGIIEAPKVDDNEKQFGKDTLIKLLEDKGEANAEEIMESIKKATLDWCGINQDDDITMIVAKRKV